MTDHIIILVMFTGTWLLGAWATFAIVKMRQTLSNKNTYQVIKEGCHVAVGELKPLQENFRPTGGVKAEIGNVIKITPSNIDECQEALQAFKDNYDKLVKLTESYPLECQFANYRFVFTSGTEIDILIKNLENKLQEASALKF